jgi:hypothetical protein
VPLKRCALIAINNKQAAKAGKAGEREILATAKHIGHAGRIQDIQALAVKRKVDAVPTQAQFVQQALAQHRSPSNREVLFALEGARAT